MNNSTEKIENIKKQMREYRDVFGDLLNVDDIDSCQTEDELKSIIDKHDQFIEDSSNDAQSALRRFKNKLF